MIFIYSIINSHLFICLNNSVYSTKEYSQVSFQIFYFQSHINIITPMLNIIIRKIQPLLRYKTFFYCSTMVGQVQGWIDKKNQPKNLILDHLNSEQKMESVYSGQNILLKQSLKGEVETNSQVFLNSLFLHQINGKNNNKSMSIIDSVNDIENELFQTKQNRVYKFCKKTNMETKIKNAQKIINVINVISSKRSRQQFQMLVKQFLNHQSQSQQKLVSKQKKLFVKLKQLLLKNLQNVEMVRQFLETFSKCDPKFIDFDSIKKVQQIESCYSYFQNLKVKKEQLVTSASKQKQKQIVEEKMSEIVNSEGLTLLKKSQNRQNPKLKKLVINPIVKQEPVVTQFMDNEENLEKVMEKLFGNKKIQTQQVIFQRVQNQSNLMYNYYGENWVYSYDLPYKFEDEDAKKIISLISSKYGEIENYTVESYHKILQMPSSQIVYALPENFESNSRKNENIQKIQVNKNEIGLKDQKKGKKKQKDLVKLILQKSKKEKELKLNKSTLIFKFKKKQDKYKFLNPEMRLYGMNFMKYKNIRFQEAQSKNIVTLTMVPWDCQSADLIRFINKALYSMNIVVTHPNCIIASGYVFLRLSNFYEAFYARQLLNNLTFQNQILKAQICYGSSFKYNGEYKHTLEFNHYEELVEKMSNYRHQFLEKAK